MNMCGMKVYEIINAYMKYWQLQYVKLKEAQEGTINQKCVFWQFCEVLVKCSSLNVIIIIKAVRLNQQFQLFGI